MESHQTPRSSEDPATGPGSAMAKEKPLSPGAGFQVRTQGHPSGPPPRYQINNGSAGGGGVGGVGGVGPRLGGQPGQPILHRLDSRSSLGSPTGPGGPFVHPRPPFGAPRLQAPQGNQIQGTIRPPPSSSTLQGGPRYPGSPSVRPPPNNFVGQRPFIYNTNQPQQIYYQPRIGEIHSQPGAQPQTRFNTDTRHSTQQIIPGTVVTPPSVTGANNQSRNFQQAARQGYPRDKMEVIDGRSPTPCIQEPNRGNAPEENDNVPTCKSSPRAEYEQQQQRNVGDDDDDDDDVVIDREKKRDTKITLPEEMSSDSPRAESAHIDSPSDPTCPASANSRKQTAPPSPAPSLELENRPTSGIKVESNEESRSTKSSPVPFEDKSRDASRSESRLDDTLNNTGPSIAEDSNDSVESSLKAAAGQVEGNADLNSEKRSGSRSSGARSSRSPTAPPRTPDHPATLSVPGSASPQLENSPNSETSPRDSGVKGFDNGQLRSLSPKSPKPPKSPNSPHSPPVIPTSADGENRKTTIAENSGDTVEPETSTEEITSPTTPGYEVKGKPPTPSKDCERARTPGGTTLDDQKSSVKRSTSGRSIKSDAGSDSGANQTNRGTPTTNGISVSPTKKLPSKSRDGEKGTAASPVKSPSKSVKSLPRTPEAGPPSTADKKKVPMNKVQVGAAPSPNLKTVRSKIGSLENASYKPGGGKVKIENRKLDFSKAQPKIAAKNDKYMPSGGDKKITQVKLQWNAKPKVGSLDNATYKPGGGDKKIETVKLDFKDKAKPKVGSKENAKHVPGGGTVKSSVTPPKTPQDPSNDIETQKIDIKAESKIGSLDNVKHKPGGGDKKIFNDRDYLRQTGSNVESLNGSGAQIKSGSVAVRPTLIEMMSNPAEPNPAPPSSPTLTRGSAAMSPVTPRALRTSLQGKSPGSPGSPGSQEHPSSGRKMSRTSSRPPSSSDTRTAADKSPKSSPRKSSPNGLLHLPKLMSPQSPDNSNAAATATQDSPKIKLPKLLETSNLSSRVKLTE